MKTALLIVDVQNDYFPNGRMELDGSVIASEKIHNVLKMFREKHLPVIHIKHISVRPNSTFFLPNTNGVEIHENVKPNEEEKIIIKNYPNSFRETELNNYLKEIGIDQLVIVGMMTHMCIDTTTRAAFDLGYISIVLGDCCATKSLNINGITINSDYVQNSFLAALNGAFAKVITSVDYLSKII